ncbi:MAG: hypothetical protein HY700_16590 [Gemmatimonadetes bacterium]|nr:hypothetical protein [Gemmatimonadota bacterium]
MASWLRILIAFIVGCHAFIYLRIGPALPSMVKEWSGSSRLLGEALTHEQLKVLVVALHVAAGIATLACAFAIGFAPAVPGWWRPLAIVGAAIGMVAFAVFWDGQVQFLAQEGVIGAVVSLILLVSAIAVPQAFAVVRP